MATIASRSQTRRRQLLTGRSREIDEFMGWIGEKVPRYNLVTYLGMGGIGKSSVLTMIKNRCEEAGIATGRVDVAEQGDPIAVVASLVTQLGTHRKFANCTGFISTYKTLESKLGALRQLDGGILQRLSRMASLTGRGVTAGATVIDLAISPDVHDTVYKALSADEAELFLDPLGAFTSAFIDDLNDPGVSTGKAVILVDTMERIPAPLDRWLAETAAQLEENAVIVVAGRTPLSGAWKEFEPVSRTVELEELSNPEAKQLLSLYGLSEEAVVAQVWAAVGGLPLGLKLCVEEWRQGRTITAGSASKGSVIEEISRTLIHGIDPELRQLLELCSALHWFHKDMLRELRPAHEVDRLFESLDALPFVRPHTRGLAIHDRVRDFVNDDMRRQRPVLSRQLHALAAGYFRGSSKDLVDLDRPTITAERVYHEVRADEKQGLRFAAEVFNDAADAFEATTCDLIYRSVINLEMPEEQRLWVAYFGGVTAKLLVDPNRAESLLRSVLDSPASHLDAHLRVYAGRWLAGSLWFSGAFHDVLRIAEETKQLSSDLHAAGDQSMTEYKHRALETLGLARDRLGEFDAGIAIMQELILSAAASNDKRGEGWGLLSAGYFSWHSGDWDRAHTHLLGCLARARDLRSDYMEVYPLGHLGLLYSALGRIDSEYFLKAGEYLGLCKRKALPATSREMDCKASQNLAQMYLYRGDLKAAEISVQESLTLALEMHHPYYEADTLRVYGEIALATGDFAQAIERFQASATRAAKIDGHYVEARSIGRMYEALVRAEVVGASTGGFDSEGVWDGVVRARRFPSVATEALMWRAWMLLESRPDESIREVARSLANAASYNRFLVERMVRFLEVEYAQRWSGVVGSGLDQLKVAIEGSLHSHEQTEGRILQFDFVPTFPGRLDLSVEPLHKRLINLDFS